MAPSKAKPLDFEPVPLSLSTIVGAAGHANMLHQECSQEIDALHLRAGMSR